MTTNTQTVSPAAPKTTPILDAEGVTVAYRCNTHGCIAEVTADGAQALKECFTVTAHHTGREMMDRLKVIAPLVGLVCFDCDADEHGDPVVGLAQEWEESPESTTVYVGLDDDGDLAVIEQGEYIWGAQAREEMGSMLEVHIERHPAYAEDLDDLKDRLEDADVKQGFLSESDLPTFGGGEASLKGEAVWSWDADYLLVGDSFRDLRIVDREC